MNASERAVVIYDDGCGMCRGFVDWVRARDRGRALEFFPCQSDELTTRFPKVAREDCERAMQLALANGQVLAGADALPELLARIPGWALASRILNLTFLRPFNRIVYRWIARNRLRDPGAAACELRR